MWPNPQFAADLVTFTEEILYGKLHFLCSGYIFQRTKILDPIWKILSLSLSYIISPTMKCIMLIILITMTKHCLEHSNNNYPQEATFYSNRFIRNETYNKKIRLAKSRTLYYDNTVRHSVWFYQMIYLVTNKSLLHVQHATKQSVVTVKESIAPFVAVSPIWNVLHLIKKFYLHQCYTGFVCVVFKVFYLFIKCETYTS